MQSPNPGAFFCAQSLSGIAVRSIICQLLLHEGYHAIMLFVAAITALSQNNTFCLLGTAGSFDNATQPGDSKYNPAASPQQSFCFNPGKPKIIMIGSCNTHFFE
jgi:hypothetical protein